MAFRAGILLFLASSPLAFGQLISNSITVTANRTMSLQPDQAVYTVTVSSGLDMTFDQVTAALQSAGVSAASLTGVSAPVLAQSSVMPSIQWAFSLPVPLANMKSTAAMLANLQTNFPQNNPGMTLSFALQGLQISQQLQQSQTCPPSGLLSDAQAKAQTLAGAAGLTLGAVLSMSGSVSNSAAGCSMTVTFALNRP